MRLSSSVSTSPCSQAMIRSAAPATSARVPSWRLMAFFARSVEGMASLVMWLLSSSAARRWRSSRRGNPRESRGFHKYRRASAGLEANAWMMDCRAALTRWGRGTSARAACY